MLRRSGRNVKKSTGGSDITNVSKCQNAKNASTDFTSSESEEESIKSMNKSPKNKKVSQKIIKSKITDTSSSESDIENYLQPIEKIDLNSSFFKIESSKEDLPSFDKIEKEIFSGVTFTRLSDSDTSEDEGGTEHIESVNPVAGTSKNDVPQGHEYELNKTLKEEERIVKLNFHQLQDYEKKIEEAKRSIELYNAKQAQENINKEVKVDVNNIEGLLAAGEAKQSVNTSQPSNEYQVSNSSNYETYTDSEQEDWEEIKEAQEKHIVPKKEFEITVEMPTTIRKKKGDDLLSAVKRRLNRIRKENQVLIHKVHLLCWIAHGNYVNSVLNDESMMALGLSLIPSERCYPSGRIDLDYLEQIIKWYKRTIKVIEKVPSKSKSLNELLTEQIDKKEAYSKKMLVLIFIIILRSLGIQCRLVISLQVESLRPSGSDLHFLGNSTDSKQKNNKGNIPKDSKVSNEENKDFKIGIKKAHVVSQHLKLNKSDEEKSRADCEGAKKIVINIERMKLDNRSEKPNRNSRSDDKSTNQRKKEKQLLTKANSLSRLEDSTLDKEHQTSSAHKERSVKYEKNALKHSNKTEKLEQIKQYNKRKDVKIKDEKKSEKTSKLKTQESRKVKTLEVPDALGNDKVKSKTISNKVVRSTRANSKSSAVDSEKTSRSKSVSTIAANSENQTGDLTKPRSKSTSSTTKNLKTSKKKKIAQLDGSDDNLEEFKGFEKSTTNKKMLRNISFENFYSQMYDQISEGVKPRNSQKIPQLDGTTDEPSTSKPNLKSLKDSSSTNAENCKSRNHLKSTRKPNYVEGTTSSSDDCFRESPIKKFKAIDNGKVVELSSSNSPEKKNCSLKNVDSGKRKGRIDLIKLNTRANSGSVKQLHSKAMDVTKDVMQLIKGRISEQKQIDKNRMVSKRKSIKYENDSEDSDYVPEVIKKKYHSDSDDEFYPKMKVKQRIHIKKEVKKVKILKKSKDTNSRKVISSDSEYTEEEIESKVEKQLKAETTKRKKGNDVWLEVFLETEEKWISVDVIFGQVHCINELYSRATHPVSYVLSWNNDDYVKDITRRYCQNYNTVTRKLRIDNPWWEESLKHFLGPKNARDKEEDDELNRQQLEKPLPTTISEYKNHPLYALERHLLKFEALYPPNAPPLGFVRNEPVYSRDCVHICHSREIWLKEAKVVKLGEKPYKIVKARPKYDKLSNTLITGQNLEIFGPWQVEDYDPPSAENGVVPRNAFGNVDLFKPSMLPKKCVHLQLPGLNKVARKMNIDCASAIIGFDFHGGWSHPVYDGFVVCEEYEDQLVAAWNLEQEDIERKEQEKYEKRVYGNWKKLIRGLLIKERLKAKYGFGNGGQETSTDSTSRTNTSSGPTILSKKRRVISDSSGSE